MPVKTKWSNCVRKYYESLGYAYTGKDTELWVSPFDLKPNASVRVLAKCDKCGRERYVRRNCYTDICGDCFGKSDENKKRLRSMSEKRWADPEQHERAREWMSERMHDPEIYEELQAKLREPVIREKIMRNTRRGASHPRWNPNKEDAARMKERAFPAYYEWRRQVFQRDSYTCVCCGQHGGKLNAHHLASWSKFPELRLDVFNGVTVCGTCHDAFHLLYGKHRGNTPEQFTEFIALKRLGGTTAEGAFSLSACD